MTDYFGFPYFLKPGNRLMVKKITEFEKKRAVADIRKGRDGMKRLCFSATTYISFPAVVFLARPDLNDVFLGSFKISLDKFEKMER